MVPYALHGGDPLDIFRINEFSERIRADYDNGGFFEGLIKKHLLTNPHYLELLYMPDPDLAAKEEQTETKQLRILEKALTLQEKESIVQEAQNLQRH